MISNKNLGFRVFFYFNTLGKSAKIVCVNSVGLKNHLKNFGFHEEYHESLHYHTKNRTTWETVKKDVDIVVEEISREIKSIELQNPSPYDIEIITNTGEIWRNKE